MHTLPDRDVVLLGIGHTNAQVLRMWRMRPPPSVRLTCVSNYAIATYSGMLPGVLAGQYPRERMEIDLVRLCAAAGARLVVADACGLDMAGQRLLFANRPPLPFDVLSIGIGSVPTYHGVEIVDGTRLLPIKPMQTFLDRIDERLQQASDERRGAPIRVAIVGGGAGGIELALCLPSRLRTLLGDDARIEETIVSGDERIVPGSLEGTARRIRRVLDRRGVGLAAGRRVVRVDDGELALDDGTIVSADLILWATGAAAPPSLATFGLPIDARGFLLTTDTLQTTSGAPVFAVGDTGSIASSPSSKAGVYAVRQGPVLWENIQRMLAGRPLQKYTPQRGFLKLLNTGDGGAIGEWKGASFGGRWCWRLKDYIDRRFIDKYQRYTPMTMTDGSDERLSATDMRCAGCGGKVGASVLSRVLERLDIPPSEHVLVGLEQPDDAAVVRSPDGRPVTVTVDFFAAPLDDPYLVGRIAALNAASDVFALGASPWAALAMVTLPVGRPRQQEELLYQLLAGSLDEFRKMGVTLVGGHTIEGPQLTVGFTVLAAQVDPPRTKGGLRAGDRLVLTKALGTGVLLAAHMRARCRASWFGPLVTSMLASNGPAAGCLEEFGIAGLTDVTGFGLAGHLLEMLRASNMAAALHLELIPLLPGAGVLLGDGLESTLAAANRDAEADIDSGRSRTDPRYQALFDPQTGGGLIIGVTPANVSGLLERLTSLGYREACVVGDIVPAAPGSRRIRIE